MNAKSICFGQIILGPPGAGKSTYCKGMCEFLGTQLGRSCAIINLDPAVRFEKQTARDIDICDLISLKRVTELELLGPNGGIIYAFEFLQQNISWLLDRIESLRQEEGIDYFIIDCPGQVELFTHYESLSEIVQSISSFLDLRLVSVYLIDFNVVYDDYSRLVGATLMALSSMLRIELPRVNVLSKIDLMPDPENNSWEDLIEDCKTRGEAGGTLQVDDDDDDDNHEGRRMTTSNNNKFHKLNLAMNDLIDDFSVVGFLGVCIDNFESVANLVSYIDKAHGYIRPTGGGGRSKEEQQQLTSKRVP